MTDQADAQQAADDRRYVGRSAGSTGCTEHVRCEPPGYWRVEWGLPAAGFSHPDGSSRA